MVTVSNPRCGCSPTPRRLLGREFGWAGVVEQQEGAERGTLRVVGKEASHREPVADPVTFGTPVNRDDALRHGTLQGMFIRRNIRPDVPFRNPAR